LHPGWEFLHETFRAAHAFTDCQGRPLGEANAPEACQRGVPFEWRECKYPGSRLHHALPMNVTALRQMTDHWPEVTAAVELLHRSYVAHFRPPSMTLLHAWRLAKFGTVIPAYLLCRPVERLSDGQIPVSAAALFKMLAGVFQTVQHMVLFGAAFGAVPTELPDPEALLAYADANDLLLDQRGVCAGPPKLIANVLHLLLRGTPGGGGEGELARSLPDFEGFFRYAAADSALQLRKFTFALATRADAVALHAELRAAWPRAHATHSVGAYLERSAEAWPIPLPDSLLDPSAADVRRRLEGVIDAEASALDEWLAAHAAAPPSRPPRSSRPPRPAHHDAPEPPSATDPAAPTAPPP
ncbi:MAG TPA: hypothetical protein VFS00_03895, partial [Polyangiaceae bacterium]|nr:hypothetical protein [Polyangiaceae bacterium]